MTMSIVDNIYRLDSEEKFRDALKLIYTTIDDLCLLGKLDDVAEFISSLDFDKLSATCLIGLLSITLSSKNDVRIAHERFKIIETIRNRFSNEDTSIVNELLDGLE